MFNVLTTNSVGLNVDFELYNTLTAEAKQNVLTAMMGGKAYHSNVAVKKKFDEAVRAEIIKKIDGIVKGQSAATITSKDLQAVIAGTSTSLVDYHYTDAYEADKNVSLDVYQHIISSAEPNALDSVAKIEQMVKEANTFIGQIKTFVEANHTKFEAKGNVNAIVKPTIAQGYTFTIDGTDPVHAYNTNGEILKSQEVVKLALTITEDATSYKYPVKISIKVTAENDNSKTDAIQAAANGNASKSQYEMFLTASNVGKTLDDSQVAALNALFHSTNTAFAATTNGATPPVYTDVTKPTEALATDESLTAMVNAIVNATNLTNSDSNRGKGDNAHDTQNLNFYSFDTLAINPTKLKALLTSDGNIVKITDDSANGIHLGSDKIYTFYALKDDNSWVQLVIDNKAPVGTTITGTAGVTTGENAYGAGGTLIITFDKKVKADLLEYNKDTNPTNASIIGVSSQGGTRTLGDDNSKAIEAIDKDSNGYATSFKITLGPTFDKSSGPVAVGDKITVVSANVVSENGIKAAGTRVEFIVPTP